VVEARYISPFYSLQTGSVVRQYSYPMEKRGNWKRWPGFETADYTCSSDIEVKIRDYLCPPLRINSAMLN
jgi:hypothetical protein